MKYCENSVTTLNQSKDEDPQCPFIILHLCLIILMLLLDKFAMVVLLTNQNQNLNHHYSLHS